MRRLFVPKDSDQCGETLMIPFYNGTNPSVSLAVCVLKLGHEGKHETSETYGKRQWEPKEQQQ